MYMLICGSDLEQIRTVSQNESASTEKMAIRKETDSEM
jgi:hypothetical protein